MTTATPTKLRTGAWGAKTSQAVSVGEVVTITTRSGKSWQARVAKVVWSGNGVSIVATSSVETARPAPRARSRSRECQCGACDDLLSFGYRPGQRITCRECGGWAVAS